MVQAMLAESGVLADMGQYINDDRWFMEQKLDGHRVMVGIEDDRVHFMNRDGNTYGHSIPAPVHAAFQSISFSGSWILDGELLDSTYYVFDLLFLGGTNAMRHTFEQRRAVLERLFESWDSQYVKLVDTAKTKDEKARLAGAIAEAHGEGVIVKDRQAKYRQGRTSGMLKLKYEKTADLIVTELNRKGKEAVGLSYIEGEKLVEVAACSTIGKESMEIGDVVEVKYLYYSPSSGGRLVQPRIMRKRQDKAPTECCGYEFVPVNKERVNW